MIPWAKFENPYAVDSACYSDIVYPLTHTVVNQIEAVNHAAALLSNDMLHNADDRRFVLAQSSPARNLYDFRSNKLRQMECAVDTLSNFIRHREALCYDQSSIDGDEEDDEDDQRGRRAGFRQDLSGMSPAAVPQDQLLDCQLSPSPPPRTSLPPQSPAHRIKSPPPALSVASSAAASSSAVYFDHAPSVPAPVSTAPTTFSHGLSIADLIHPSSAPAPGPSNLSPPLTPDSDLERDSNGLCSPNQELLQATLASIRATRQINQSLSIQSPAYYRASSSPRAAGRGRNLRLPRMRRSSRSRKHEEMPQSLEMDPVSLSISDTRRVICPPRNVSTPEAESRSAASSTQNQAPGRPPPSPARQSARNTQCERTSLDKWWDTQRELHHCDEYDDIHSSPPLAVKSALMATSWGAPRQTPTPRATSQPRLLPAIASLDAIEADDAEEPELYAYARPGAPVRSTSPCTTTYRYGYIAGDVPGAREGKLRVRGHTRESTRGRYGGCNGEQQRALSGVKRRRMDTPELEQWHISGSKKQIKVDYCGDQTELLGEAGPIAESSRSRIEDEEDEADQQLILEAKRLAERWWKEPLMPSTS